MRDTSKESFVGCIASSRGARAFAKSAHVPKRALRLLRSGLLTLHPQKRVFRGALMSRQQHSLQRGFTLLEVIVAVVIAALCLSALSQVFATGVRSASASSDYMRAMTLAQGLLAGAGIEKTLSDGRESGVSSDGRLQWSLTVAAEPVEEGDALIRPPLELKRLVARVAVSNPGDVPGAKQRNVELTTLLAVPRPLP